jgi:hypothetical protein
MMMAAQYDGLQQFVYAVAGAAGDAECGMCFQVRRMVV